MVDLEEGHSSHRISLEPEISLSLEMGDLLLLLLLRRYQSRLKSCHTVCFVDRDRRSFEMHCGLVLVVAFSQGEIVLGV